MTEYYGKYRGTVANNIDPLLSGRIQVEVPAVFGEGQLSWAMPNVPFAGPGLGFYAIPPIGANVWVEFEAGDSEYPIWCGCFWNQNQAPTTSPAPLSKVLKTDTVTMTFDDPTSGGGLSIETTSGTKITITDAGIQITTGKGASIDLTGPTVSVNGGALEVT
jgi:uncharacterized protein involved in type VI secretion and phage assembly